MTKGRRPVVDHCCLTKGRRPVAPSRSSLLDQAPALRLHPNGIHWFLHQRKRHKIDLSCLTGPAVGRPVQRQFHSSFPRPTDQVAVIFQQESRCRSRSRGQPTMSSNASVVPHSFTGGELRCSVGFALIHKRGGPVPLNCPQNTSENSSGTLHAIQSCLCPF